MEHFTKNNVDLTIEEVEMFSLTLPNRVVTQYQLEDFLQEFNQPKDALDAISLLYNKLPQNSLNASMWRKKMERK